VLRRWVKHWGRGLSDKGNKKDRESQGAIAVNKGMRVNQQT